MASTDQHTAATGFASAAITHPKPVPHPKPKPTPKKPPAPKRKPAVKKPAPAKPTVAELRQEIVREARSLVGIHEIPYGSHSNSGPDVARLQTSTGAYRQPWCVSTRQYIDLRVLGSTWANKTASVYAYEDYARAHGCIIARPVVGCVVCYHFGQGHMGTVISVHADGTFDAVEGNEGDAVRIMPRDPRVTRCVFVLRPELK